MQVFVARGITYSVLGVMAWAALQVTPPVARIPGDVLATCGTGGGTESGLHGATAPQRSVQPTLSPAACPTLRSDGLRPMGAIAAVPVGRLLPAPTVAVAPVVVNARRLERPDTVAISGTIHSSLMASLDHVGVGEFPKGQRRSLAWRLADIFEYRIDMARDLKEGDQFHILVERLQEPNGKIIVNKILGARLALRKHVFEAVHFKSQDSNSEWFDGKGKSLTAAFLRAPLEFKRISSVFGEREHPILGSWRNHTGTDYAAPMGTPVRAIGDGVVVSAGWMGGYGNAIDIRHSNGYISRYGHLERLAAGMHTGAHVGMGSTIGYVGMTGWATGPHLHFEIRINGVAHDPSVALQGRSGSPLPASEERLFREIREHTMAALGGTDRAEQRVAMRSGEANSAVRVARAGL